MGFPVTARHRSKNVTLHRQGDINFIINAEPGSFGQRFAQQHGPSACAMAFRVRDAAHGFPARGGTRRDSGREPRRARWSSTSRPSRASAGASCISSTATASTTIYDVDFVPVAQASLQPARPACTLIDHLTHNVQRGRMGHWAGFYERLFNFREIRYFDIKASKTGLLSRAMTSPCGKIRIPINESQDDKSQIEEYLRELSRRRHPAHRARHRRHLRDGGPAARATASSSRTRRTPITTADRPARCRATARSLDELRQPAHPDRRQRRSDGDRCCRSSRKNVIGPIFFEIIQRKGNEGFGEGNFRALFESIELDQERRGVI